MKQTKHAVKETTAFLFLLTLLMGCFILMAVLSLQDGSKQMAYATGHVPTPTYIPINVTVIDRSPNRSPNSNPNAYIQNGIAEANQKSFNGIGMNMSAPTVTDSTEFIFEVNCDPETGNAFSLTQEFGNKWQDDSVVILIIGMFNENCGDANLKGVFIPWKQSGGATVGRKIIMVRSGMGAENLGHTIAHEFGHLARMNHATPSNNLMYAFSPYNEWTLSTSVTEVDGGGFYAFPKATSSNPRNQIQTFQNVWINNNEFDDWD